MGLREWQRRERLQPRDPVATCLAVLLVSAIAHAIEPKPPEGYLKQKEFFLPELAISSANAPLDEVLPALPNRAAWTRLLQARAPAGDGATHGFVDPRSRTATGLIGASPLLPGPGVGNQVSIEDLSARLGRPARSTRRQSWHFWRSRARGPHSALPCANVRLARTEKGEKYEP